jgi:hypothetical protein
MDWNEASDREVLEQLRKAELAQRLETSDEWKLIHECLRRTYDGHIKLLRKEDPTNEVKMMELQQICNMYAEDFLPALIRNFQSIAEFAFEEAKRRNLLQRFLDSFK